MKQTYRESCAWNCSSLNLYDVACVGPFPNNQHLKKKTTCGSDMQLSMLTKKGLSQWFWEAQRETKGEICDSYPFNDWNWWTLIAESISLPFVVAIDPFNQAPHLRWYSWHLGVFTFHIYQHGATIHTGNRAVIAMLETMNVTNQSVKFDDMLNLLYVQGFGALISWY